MLVPKKRHGCAPEGAHTESLKGFYLFFRDGILGEISGEGLNRIFISFPGVFFNMLICQNECIGEFGIILWSLSLLCSYLGSGSNCFFFVVVVICSPDFTRSWVCLAQMALTGSLLPISQSSVISAMYLWLSRRGINHLLSSVLGWGDKVLWFTSWL